MRACSVRAGVLGAGVDVQQCVEQARQGHAQEQQGEGQGQVAEEMLRRVGQFRHQTQTELHHQRRGGLCQALQHLVMAQVFDPAQRRLARQQTAGVQHKEACDAPQHQRDQQQHAQAQGRVQ